MNDSDRLQAQRWTHLLGVIALSVLLGGCGFQLRGSADIPPEWLELNLASASPNSELSNAINNGFTANGVNWLERSDANYVLEVGPEQYQRRNLTVGANARASEYELEMTTTLRITDTRGQELMPQTELTVFKIITSDLNNITGKVEETRLLKQEMRQELVQQMLRRVRFLASSQNTAAAAS